MNIGFKFLMCVAVFTAAASAQPRIDGVFNSASYGLTGMPNEGVAQGSIATAFGAGFGGAGVKQVSALPLETTFEGLSVRITVNGTPVDAYPVQIANGTQFSFVIPSNTPVGTGTIVATFGGQTTAPVAIKVVANNFGVYSANYSGEGPGVVDDAVSFQRNTVTRSAKPGDIVAIWGTGLGAVDGPANALPPNGQLNVNPLRVYIGGKEATVQYQGRTPCCVGVDQINAVVPEGVSGCAVPVVVQAGSVVSNFTTISVAANGGTCSDPLLSAERINAINQPGGALRTGGISLNRIRYTVAGQSLNIDTAVGFFDRYNYNDLLNGAGSSFVQATGSCVVTTYREGETEGAGDFGTPLDAGNPLSLTTPGVPKQLQRGLTGLYSIPLDISNPTNPFGLPWMEPGSYTIAGPGGQDVGAFSQAFAVPATLNWTNQDAINTINRSQGLPITWTGGGANDYVLISGSSTASGAPGTPTAAFTCWERAPVGNFTVPSVVLASLPVTPGGDEDLGSLNVGSFSNPVQFSPVPTGLDEAWVTTSVLNGKQVRYQ